MLGISTAKALVHESGSRVDALLELEPIGTEYGTALEGNAFTGFPLALHVHGFLKLALLFGSAVSWCVHGGGRLVGGFTGNHQQYDQQ
jgi:hypothetical protein